MFRRLKEFKIGNFISPQMGDINGEKHRWKVYIFLALSILILSWESHIILPAHAIQQTSTTEDSFIPKESIRLRIKANSNSAIDQSVKINIRNAVNKEITSWVKDIPDLDEARKVIQSKMDELHSIVGAELKKAGKNDPYEVSLQQTDFPTKLYGKRLYPAGEYEALLITIGDGRGDNWWCVLFPPLCFLDFSGKTEHIHDHDYADDEEIEVSFFIVELFMSIWERIFA